MSNHLNIAIVAHRADLKSSSPQGKNWVDTLKANLALRLQQLTACVVNVVVLEPHSDLESQWNDSEDALFDVLLPVYSKHFYHSDTAIRFTQQLQNHHTQPLSSCFALFRQRLEEDSLPAAIHLHNHFHFWRKDSERERIQMFEPGNRETERFFWGKIDDTANEIYAHWLKTERKNDPNANSPSAEANDQVVVFLAECSPDMLNYRDLLKRDLIDNGVLVYPFSQDEKPELKDWALNLTVFPMGDDLDGSVFVQIYWEYNLKATEDITSLIAAKLIDINFKLPLGSLGISPETSNIYYRLILPLPLETTITAPFLADVYDMVMYPMETYHPELSKLL